MITAMSLNALDSNSAAEESNRVVLRYRGGDRRLGKGKRKIAFRLSKKKSGLSNFEQSVFGNVVACGYACLRESAPRRSQTSSEFLDHVNRLTITEMQQAKAWIDALLVPAK